MKIALLTDGIYPYVIGGMQKHSFYLLKYLLKRGVYVDLYHTNASSLDIGKMEYLSEEEKKYLKHFVIDFPARKKWPGHYMRSSYAYSSAIFEQFKKNSTDADFVYAKGFCAWRLLEERSKEFKCAPIGINFHGFEMFQPAPDLKELLAQRLLLRKPVKYNLKYADYIFSYGGKITDIIQELNEDRSRIIELPAGIELSWLNTETKKLSSPLKFVFVGRYERRKGIQELNKALLALSKSSLPFEFCFVGPIPEAKRLKLKNVSYPGSINDASVLKELLQKQDVLVCPSHSEGMPNVIMEGMASGLAVVASDVGAIRLMVDSSNGILIKAGDTKAITEAITTIIGMDQTALLALKEASVRKVQEQFLWDVIIQKTIEALTKAAMGKST